MTDGKIIKGLEQEAQTILERMPMETTAIEIEKKADMLSQLIEQNGWTHSQVAKMIGVHQSRLSQFLNGKYRGDNKKMLNLITNLLNTYDRKGRQKSVGYIETAVAKKIQAIIRNTEALSTDEGKIGIIIGDGGHGKSLCLRHYAEANQNTIYVELDSAMNSTAMFAAIAEAFKLDAGGSLSSITRRLIGYLQNRLMVVMLDEASSLTVKKLDQLRQVIAVKSRCPLILSGNDDLRKTLIEQRSRRGYGSLDQFVSRCTCILDLNALANDRNGGGLYTVRELRELYQYGGVRLTDSALNSLRKICMTPWSGRLRTCDVIIASLHTSKAVEKQIDAGLIVDAINQLGLPVQAYLPISARTITEETGQGQVGAVA